MDNNIETLLRELERASMRPEDSTYNGVTEKQSSYSYQQIIDNLYANAVSDLYGLNDSQRAIVRKRIDEVRDIQKYFNIPPKETVNALLRDYNAQPDGKRCKSLLDDYRYCTFVLECVAIQKDYLERFAALVTVETSQDTSINTKPDEDTATDSNSDTAKDALKDKVWLTSKEAAEKYPLLAYNNIKNPQWRIENDFPYKGYDERKGRYCKVRFNSEDVENWIQNNS